MKMIDLLGGSSKYSKFITLCNKGVCSMLLTTFWLIWYAGYYAAPSVVISLPPGFSW